MGLLNLRTKHQGRHFFQQFFSSTNCLFLQVNVVLKFGNEFEEKIDWCTTMTSLPLLEHLIFWWANVLSIVSWLIIECSCLPICPLNLTFGVILRKLGIQDAFFNTFQCYQSHHFSFFLQVRIRNLSTRFPGRKQQSDRSIGWVYFFLGENVRSATKTKSNQGLI